MLVLNKLMEFSENFVTLRIFHKLKEKLKVAFATT